MDLFVTQNSDDVNYINLTFQKILSKGKALMAFPLFFLLSHLSFSQFLEVGAGFGAFNYTGDLVRQYNYRYLRPAGTIFLRQNISEPVSFRYSLTGGWLTGSDVEPIDPFAARRDYDFSVGLIELSAVMEYHFFDYRSEKSLIDWSPYLFLGAGVFTILGHDETNEDYSNTQLAFPMGLGIKHILGKRFIIGAEFGARKTLFDYLDNRSEGNISNKNYQYGDAYNDDWYYYLGIHLNYTFFDIPCPYKFF